MNAANAMNAANETNDLQSRHRALGARLAADGIPLDYGDAAAEFSAALESAILLDRSHEGRILLTGSDRFELVSRMSTNRLLDLQPGEGRPTIFTNSNARILYRAMTYHRPEGFLLISEPGQGAALAAYLQRNIFFGDRVKVHDHSAATTHFALHGPAAAAVMQSLQPALADLPPLYSATAAAEITAARRKAVSGEHWILLCPRAQAAALHRQLLQIGSAAGLQPAGSLCYNTLRIRRGRPAAPELNADYLPLEVGLWDEVSFDKGCYTGQEIIARMESRQRLAKTLVKLQLPRFVPAPAPVFDASSRPVGRLTSSAAAPDGRIYALAVIKTASAAPQTALTVGGGQIPAQVLDYAGAQPDFVRAAGA